MPKKSKAEKQGPNIVLFLVEGDSDRIALETSLAMLIEDKNPEYQVRFLLQRRPVNQSGTEVEDAQPDGEDDELPEDQEYTWGGDVTASVCVKPENIEMKIHHRFIKPVTLQEGIYPKKIARIIQIVDLDGVYLPDTCVAPYAPERQNSERVYYDGENGFIETDADKISEIVKRNKRKRDNLNYLLALPEGKIKIGSKKIPYEIYFFSSNLDAVIHHDANVEAGKKYLADRFLRSHGLDPEDFAAFFLKDPCAVGQMGYRESWDFIRENSNSVKRYTNIDCLIRSLMQAP